MNNIEEQFQINNKKLLDDLSTELTTLLKKLEANHIISLDDRKKVTILLDKYIEVLKIPENVVISTMKRTHSKISTKFNQMQVIGELEDFKKSIELLLRVGREKVIRADVCNASEEGMLLVKEDYLEEIIATKSKEKYYILSSKGIRSLKNKNVLTHIRKSVNSFSIPNSSVNEFDDWSSLYCERIYLLNRYFEEYRNSKEYFAFTINESNEFVLACEITNDIDVNYVFPAVFSKTEKEKDIENIVGISESGLVDNILILVDNEQKRDELTNDYGLNPSKLSHITYCVMN